MHVAARWLTSRDIQSNRSLFSLIINEGNARTKHTWENCSNPDDLLFRLSCSIDVRTDGLDHLLFGRVGVAGVRMRTFLEIPARLSMTPAAHQIDQPETTRNESQSNQRDGDCIG